MYQAYRLDPAKLRQAMAHSGVKNVSAVLRKSGLHRNSINEYLSGKRSVFSQVTNKLARALNCDPLSLLAPEDSPSSILDENGRKIAEFLDALASKSKFQGLAFFLLGSRASGRARALSDWDIAVTGGARGLSTREYLQLKSEIEDLSDDLPVGVDVINFDSAPGWFLAGIGYQPVFLSGDRNSFAYVLGVLNGSRKTRED